MIDAGYGKEITITRKGGLKEKVQVLDWTRLAEKNALVVSFINTPKQKINVRIVVIYNHVKQLN